MFLKSISVKSFLLFSGVRGGDAADHLGSLGGARYVLGMGVVWPVVGGGFRPGACAVFGA